MVGSEARIRVSSATSPLSSGTFRSARRRTRLPSTSASRTLALVSERDADVSGTDRRRLQHLLRQIDAAIGVAPLVVVPGEELDEGPVDHLGLLGVEDGGVRIGDDVTGDDRVLRVLEDPLEGSRRGFL